MKNNLFGKLVKKYIFGDLSDDQIRQKLYDGLLPYNYQDAWAANYARIQGALKEPFGDPTYFSTDRKNYTVRDDIFATYLGIPKEKRHKNVSTDLAKVEKSTYSPTKGFEGNTYYKIQNLSQQEKEELIREGLSLLPGESATSEALDQYFSTHTVSRGVDNKGDYVSYYGFMGYKPICRKI